MTTFVDTVAYIATRDESLRKVTLINNPSPRSSQVQLSIILGPLPQVKSSPALHHLGTPPQVKSSPALHHLGTPPPGQVKFDLAPSLTCLLHPGSKFDALILQVDLRVIRQNLFLIDFTHQDQD